MNYISSNSTSITSVSSNTSSSSPSLGVLHPISPASVSVLDISLRLTGFWAGQIQYQSSLDNLTNTIDNPIKKGHILIDWFGLELYFQYDSSGNGIVYGYGIQKLEPKQIIKFNKKKYFQNKTSKQDKSINSNIIPQVFQDEIEFYVSGNLKGHTITLNKINKNPLTKPIIINKPESALNQVNNRNNKRVKDKNKSNVDSVINIPLWASSYLENFTCEIELGSGIQNTCKLTGFNNNINNNHNHIPATIELHKIEEIPFDPTSINKQSYAINNTSARIPDTFLHQQFGLNPTPPFLDTTLNNVTIEKPIIKNLFPNNNTATSNSSSATINASSLFPVSRSTLNPNTPAFTPGAALSPAQINNNIIQTQNIINSTGNAKPGLKHTRKPANNTNSLIPQLNPVNNLSVSTPIPLIVDDIELSIQANTSNTNSLLSPILPITNTITTSNSNTSSSIPITPLRQYLYSLFGSVMGLKYSQLLESQEVDLEALTLMNETHLKELGIPLGPRIKLLAALKQQQENNLNNNPIIIA